MLAVKSNKQVWTGLNVGFANVLEGLLGYATLVSSTGQAAPKISKCHNATPNNRIGC